MGIALRPLRDGDVVSIVDVVNRSNAHDGIREVVDEAEIAELIGTVDAERDVIVATDGDGVVTGYALVWFDPSGERLERAFVFGSVAPEHRRRGAGRALLDWGTDRARALLANVANELPKVIRGDVYEQVEDAHRLFTRAGYVQVRWFEDLLRPLTDLPSVPLDEDYEIVSWPSDRGDEIRAVRNEAFADHWGTTPWSPQRFAEVVTGYGARLDLSVVAVERRTGDLVAFSFNEHHPRDVDVTGRRDGWIGVLGTRADHRGRGLASALIAESLRRFAAAGLTHAAIGVDSDSLTGAQRLYRSLGFAPMDRHVTYELNALSSKTRF